MDTKKIFKDVKFYLSLIILGLAIVMAAYWVVDVQVPCLKELVINHGM